MAWSFKFRPKLQETLQGYSRPQFSRDVAAGLTVGVLALPLAMAFAIASGASPSAGLWTAIIAGFLISALGGSRVQVGGPTGAFIPILYAIVAAYGLHNMLAATVLAGLILLVMGLMGLGALIRYIPVSVVIGFTNGIAVVIFLSQVPDFLGLPIPAVPAEFFARMQVLGEHLAQVDLPSAALGLGSAAVIVAWALVTKRRPAWSLLPSQLVGLVSGTILSVALSLPVETIGSRFNGIPQSLPAFALPLPDLGSLGKLLVPALTIAMLGAIESLLSARVADVHVEDRHDPNQELMAQGLANVVVPFFGGIAATGAIARTATNIKAGGRTPVAGIVHAVTLLAIVLIAAPLAAYIPIPTLAAIVMVTAVRMGEWHEFRRLRRFSWNYGTVLMSTFIVTVLFDLTIAIELGMVLASLFFIYRMQDLSNAERVSSFSPAEVTVFRVRGSIFFGSVGKLDNHIDANRIRTPLVVLDMEQVVNIDTTGIDWLAGLHKTLLRQGVCLRLAALGPQPLSLVQRSGLAAQLGEGGVSARVTEALGEVAHVA